MITKSQCFESVGERFNINTGHALRNPAQLPESSAD